MPIRPCDLPQAVQFLVIGNKQKRTLEEITTDLCPVLSIQQLYRISTMYWDDRWGVGQECGAEVHSSHQRHCLGWQVCSLDMLWRIVEANDVICASSASQQELSQGYVQV